MSECFDRAGGFPLLLIGEVRNGESTGTLDQSFERVTSFFDQEAKRSVQGMIAAFGPLIVLILGGIFGIVILSVLMPLYDVIGGVKIY
jgi:type IV pilus assembly protein PilC